MNPPLRHAPLTAPLQSLIAEGRFRNPLSPNTSGRGRSTRMPVEMVTVGHRVP